MLNRWASITRSSAESGSRPAGLTCTCGFVERPVDVGVRWSDQKSWRWSWPYLACGIGANPERERVGWALERPG